MIIMAKLVALVVRVLRKEHYLEVGDHRVKFWAMQGEVLLQSKWIILLVQVKLSVSSSKKETCRVAV